MWIVRLAFLASLTVLGACKDEPRYTASSESAAVDRARLCTDGGATLDQASNECVCTEGQSWSGIRCEAPAVATTPVVEAAVPPSSQDPEPEDASSAVAADPAPDPAPAPLAADADFASRLKNACKRAKGTWLENDLYCHCDSDKVLVARRCRTLTGNVTDDACLRAVNKGKWKQGVCSCEPGLVFSPSRGGCVAKFTGNTAVLRRVCESSLNNGKWDAMGDRCRCPEGRVWAGELCQVQQRLSSKTVCESGTNRGTWQNYIKQCACPTGFFWIDQACQRATTVSDQEACESESNRGRFDAALVRCLCPGLTHWRADTKSCSN